jgi:phage terminase Nu1 subunit (DNA packaging protein)
MSIVTVTEFAEFMGWTQPAVSTLIKEGMPAGEPPAKKGMARRFESSVAVRWIFEQRAAKHRTPDDGETLNEANLRRARADADLAEVKASEAANVVLPLAEAEALIERMMVLVATQLDGIAGRVAATVAAETDPAVCRATIFDECRRVREAMAAEFQARATVAQGEAGDPAAAGEDAGPVG